MLFDLSKKNNKTFGTWDVEIRSAQIYGISKFQEYNFQMYAHMNFIFTTQLAHHKYKIIELLSTIKMAQVSVPGNALTRISERASELHHDMMNSQHLGYQYKQPELQDMAKAKDINELMRYVQELTNNVCQSLSNRENC